MQLIDEIITLASSEEGSLGTLLRKCLVLAHRLKNDRLKSWAESELNGYNGDDDAVPPYRKISAPAKGLFLGPFDSQINNQPLPPLVLKEQHRHWAETVILRQPIASYEGISKDDSLAIPWPANLTALYQAKFFEGRYALNRAWQEIPPSFLIGLTDSIRTKVLSFALELQDELGEASENIQALPPGKIDQTFVTHIYGGMAIIGSKDFTQIGNIEIDQGDLKGLSDALESRLGLDRSSVSELKGALAEDAEETAKPSFGKRTAGWLATFGKQSGQAALNIGVEVAKKEATKWIFQYLGLPQ